MFGWIADRLGIGGDVGQALRSTDQVIGDAFQAGGSIVEGIGKGFTGAVNTPLDFGKDILSGRNIGDSLQAAGAKAFSSSQEFLGYGGAVRSNAFQNVLNTPFASKVSLGLSDDATKAAYASARIQDASGATFRQNELDSMGRAYSKGIAFGGAAAYAVPKLGYSGSVSTYGAVASGNYLGAAKSLVGAGVGSEFLPDLPQLPNLPSLPGIPTGVDDFLSRWQNNKGRVDQVSDFSGSNFEGYFVPPSQKKKSIDPTMILVGIAVVAFLARSKR